MADPIGQAYLDIKPDLTSLQKQMGAFMAGSRWKSLGTAAGAALGGAIAAAGIGKALYEVGQEFDSAFDKIETRTDASGKQLSKLKDDFRNVLGSMPTDMDTAAEAVAGLNQRLDLSGKPLRNLSKQLIALNKITGEDLETTIPAVTRLFGDWSVKTEKQERSLDKLYRLTQVTGTTITDLSELMVQFGAPLRSLGFSFDEAAAMFGRFEKEGVNLQTLMPGMRMGLKNLSLPTDELKAKMKDLGIAMNDPEQAFQDVLDQFLSGDLKRADQTFLASAVFGGRAWADMARAIIEGRFEFDDLVDTMRKGDDTIRGAERRTRDFSEQWEIFKNRLKLAVEPVATRVFKRLGDLMKDLNKAFKRGGLSEVFDVLLEKFEKALPDILDFAAKAGVKIAAAFVKGFTQAPILAQLLVGTWLLKKFGGIGALTKTGSKGGGIAGRAFARGFIAAVVGYEIFSIIKDKLIPQIEEDFSGFLGGIFPGHGGGTGGTRTRQHAEEGQKAFDVAKDWQQKLDRLARRHQAIREGDFNKHTIKILREYHDQGATLYDISAAFGEKVARKVEQSDDRKVRSSKRSGDKVADNSRESGRKVVGNTDNMVGGVGRGMRRLEDLLNRALKPVNAKPVNFGINSAKAAGGQGFAAFHQNQRGAFIDEGKPFGDSVPSILEKGEGVLNRVATAALGGKRFIDWANSKWSRFAQGGVAGGGGLKFALGPYDIPPIQYAADHAGGNSHVHIAMSSVAAAKAMAARIRPMGWMASEAPWAGGVAAVHQDPGHYTGSSFDANTAADETRSQVEALARVLGGGDVGLGFERIKRILLTGPKGALLNAGQGALDRARKASNAFLRRQVPTGMAPKGGWQGINSAAEFIPFWNKVTGLPAFAGAFSKIVPAESGWDPTAGGPGTSNPTHRGWYQFDAPTWSDFGKGPWLEGASNPSLATAAAGNVARREGWAGVMSRWAQTFAGRQRGGMADWAGAFGSGGKVTARRPTLLAIGDRGTETATIHRGEGHDDVKVIVNGTIITEDDLDDAIEVQIGEAAPRIAEYVFREGGRNRTRARSLGGRAGRF